MMNSKKWSFNTRFLHLGLVIIVTVQLFVSLVMIEPEDKGSLLGRLAYETHEMFGLATLAIVLMHWAWSLFSKVDGGLGHYFPTNKKARERIYEDLRSLMSARLPDSNKKGGLVGLIHGMGLIAVTGAAMTGTAYFILAPEVGDAGFLAEGFEELHEGIATFVWAYWIGHGGVAILHHLRGENTLFDMFMPGSKSNKSARTKIGTNKELEQH